MVTDRETLENIPTITAILHLNDEKFYKFSKEDSVYIIQITTLNTPMASPLNPIDDHTSSEIINVLITTLLKDRKEKGFSNFKDYFESMVENDCCGKLWSVSVRHTFDSDEQEILDISKISGADQIKTNYIFVEK